MLRVTTNVASSFANEELTLCWLLEIAMPDGTFKRFSTLGSIDITVGGDVFYGFPGFDFSSAGFSIGDTPPAIDVEFPAGDNGEITFAEAASSIIDGATAKLWICDWVAATRDRIGSIYYVTQIRTSDEGAVSLSLSSASRRKRHFFIKRYGPGCRWVLGETGCGVNLASYTESVTVVTNADLLTLTVTGFSSPAPADDYFNLGALKFTSGDNAGLSYEIRKFTASSGTINLATPLRTPAANGDALDMHPGCDRTTGAAGCARFSNFARRLAFDHLPDDTLTAQQPLPPAQQATSGGRNRFGPYARR